MGATSVKAINNSQLKGSQVQGMYLAKDTTMSTNLKKEK